MGIVREVTIGNCRLIQADNRDVIGALEYDAICTDPPYGIGESKKSSVRTSAAKGDARWMGRGPTNYAASDWDAIPADVAWVAAGSIPAIVWGGNYFGLPPSNMWLVWDKMTAGADFADCELAWTNQKGAVRKFEWLWSGFRKQVPEKRFHPTQKPVALMEWCLGFLPKAQTILDPFCGSGSTGVACVNLGRSFIGIELDSGYFDIAVRRITDAHRQADMFVAKPAIATPTQEVLL